MIDLNTAQASEAKSDASYKKDSKDVVKDTNSIQEAPCMNKSRSSMHERLYQVTIIILLTLLFVTNFCIERKQNQESEITLHGLVPLPDSSEVCPTIYAESNGIKVASFIAEIEAMR